jgi:curli biogenesis system outer membrane secretion channel CsgG
MTRIARYVSLAAALVGVAAPLAASHAQKPTVAILAFENGSFGKDAKDYDGLSKGVPGFLVTDMASNPNLRVIERDQVQRLIDEQKLVTGGHVDQATAVKIGKLLGAQHMIFGTFMVDPKSNFRIDARAVNVETGAIEDVQRVDDKADNIMGAIGQLATKLNSGMKLPAPQQASAAATVKLPMRVAVMYGKALDLADHGDKKKAEELFGAVLKEFPTYTPAQTELGKIKGS